MRIAAVLAIVVFLILLFHRSGNRKEGEKMPNISPKDSGQVTAAGALGEGGINFLPKDFPRDLPVFPGASLVGKGEGENPNSGFVVFSVSSPLQQITKYYRESLKKAGWEIKAVSEDSSGTSFSVVKGSQASTVGLKNNGGNILLSLTYGPE